MSEHEFTGDDPIYKRFMQRQLGRRYSQWPMRPPPTR